MKKKKDSIETSYHVNFVEEEQEIIIDHEDYISTTFGLDELSNQISVNVISHVPSNLSSTQKGYIGEIIAKLYLDIWRENPEVLTEAQKPGSPFDILDLLKEIRFDAKFSLVHRDRQESAGNWKFCLAGDRNEKDYKKDLDYLILIGANPDTEEQPIVFVIPTSEGVIMDLATIDIPVSGKGKYMRFMVDPKEGGILEAIRNLQNGKINN